MSVGSPRSLLTAKFDFGPQGPSVVVVGALGNCMRRVAPSADVASVKIVAVNREWAIHKLHVGFQLATLTRLLNSMHRGNNSRVKVVLVAALRVIIPPFYDTISGDRPFRPRQCLGDYVTPSAAMDPRNSPSRLMPRQRRPLFDEMRRPTDRPLVLSRRIFCLFPAQNSSLSATAY